MLKIAMNNWRLHMLRARTIMSSSSLLVVNWQPEHCCCLTSARCQVYAQTLISLSGPQHIQSCDVLSICTLTITAGCTNECTVYKLSCNCCSRSAAPLRWCAYGDSLQSEYELSLPVVCLMLHAFCHRPWCKTWLGLNASHATSGQPLLMS